MNNNKFNLRYNIFYLSFCTNIINYIGLNKKNNSNSNSNRSKLVLRNLYTYNLNYNKINFYKIIKIIYLFFFFFLIGVLFIYFFQFEIILWWYPDVVIMQLRNVLDNQVFLEEPVNYLLIDGGYLLYNDKLYVPNEILYIIYSLYKYKKYIHKLQYVYNYNDFILPFLTLDRYANKITHTIMPGFNEKNRRNPSGFFVFIYPDQHRYDRDYEVNRLQLWFKWLRKDFYNLEIDEYRWGYFKIRNAFNKKMFYYDNFFKYKYLEMLNKYKKILINKNTPNYLQHDYNRIFNVLNEFNLLFNLRKLHEYVYNRNFNAYYTLFPNYKFNRQNRLFGWGLYNLDIEWDPGYDRYYFTARRVKPYRFVPIFSKSFYYSNNFLKDISPLINSEIYQIINKKIKVNKFFKIKYEDLPLYIRDCYDNTFFEKNKFFKDLVKNVIVKKIVLTKPLELIYLQNLNKIYKKRRKWLLKKMLHKYLYFSKRKNIDSKLHYKILDFLYYGNLYKYYQFYDLLYKLESFFKFENINYYVMDYNKFFSWYEKYYRDSFIKMIFDDLHNYEYELRKSYEYKYFNNLNYILFDYLNKISKLNKFNNNEKKNYILFLYNDLNYYIYNNFFKKNIEPYRFKNYFMMSYLYRNNIKKLQYVSDLLYKIIRNDNILFKELFYKNKRFKRFLRSHSLFLRKNVHKYARRYFKYSNTVQPFKYKQTTYPVGFGFNRNRKQKRKKIQLVSYKMPNRFDLLYDEFFLKQNRFNKKFIGFSSIDIELGDNKFNPLFSYRMGDQYDNLSRATFWRSLYTRYKYRVKNYFFFKKNLKNNEFVKIYAKLKLSYFTFFKKFNFLKKSFLNYLKLKNLYYENIYLKIDNNNFSDIDKEKSFNEQYLLNIILNFIIKIGLNVFNFLIVLIKKILILVVCKIKIIVKMYYQFLSIIYKFIYNKFNFSYFLYYFNYINEILVCKISKFINIYVLKMKNFLIKKFFFPDKIIYVNVDKLINNIDFKKFIDDFEVLDTLCFKNEVPLKHFVISLIFNKNLSEIDKDKLWLILSKEIYNYGKYGYKLNLLYNKIDEINKKKLNQFLREKRVKEKKKDVAEFEMRRDYDMEMGVLPREEAIMRLKKRFDRYIKKLVLNNKSFKTKLLLRDDFDVFTPLYDTVIYPNLYNLNNLKKLKLFYQKKLINNDFRKLKKEQIYTILKLIEMDYNDIVKFFKIGYFNELNKVLKLKREDLAEKTYHHLYPLEQNPDIRDDRVDHIRKWLKDEELIKRRGVPYNITQARNNKFLDYWILRKNQFVYNYNYKNYYLYKIPGRFIFTYYRDRFKYKLKQFFRNERKMFKKFNRYLQKKFKFKLIFKTLYSIFFTIKRIIKKKILRRRIFRRIRSYLVRLKKYYMFIVYLKEKRENKFIMPYVILDMRYVERLFKSRSIYKYRLILFYVCVLILSSLFMRKVFPILDIDSDDLYEADFLIYVSVCIFIMIHCYINLRGYYLRSGNKVTKRSGIRAGLTY